MSTNLAYTVTQDEKGTIDETNLLDQYMKEINHQSPLSIQEERMLVQRIREGDPDALDRLVKAHLRFVVSIAIEYRNKGLPFLDVINEGNIGLITAAKRFDETRGLRFISYAVWWIRQAIRQAFANHVRMIRLPRLQVEKLSQLAEDVRSREQDAGQAVTPQTVMANTKTDTPRMHQLLATSARPFSLDEPNDEKGETCLIDFLEDSQNERPDEQTITKQCKAYIKEAISTLPDREAHVICEYFGFDGEPRTLEEIGHELDLSRERVRQLKEQGLQRLRHRSHRIRLHGLL